MRRFFILSSLSLVSACSGGNTVTSFVYDACYDVNDCVEAATLCEELTVEFAGFIYTNAICTTECASEGALAPDCSRALIGRRGSCYPSSVAGGIDDTLVCFEPCDTDANCLQGFRCLGGFELCGAAAESCPITPGDAICVPGPG